MNIQSQSMVPIDEELPNVLPTERLQANGMFRPEFRQDMRNVPSIRNIGTLLMMWLQSFGVVYLANWIDNPLVWIVTFFLMGRIFVHYAILMHEASHRSLFKNKKINDFTGSWLLAYPVFIPFGLYRRGHMAHHKDEMGPNEPDMLLYANYPTTKASFWRKIRRDIFFVSGWKNLRDLLKGLSVKSFRGTVIRIFIAQIPIAIILWLCSGYWWAYIVFWFIPWMTLWRLFNRLRAIAEHAGMERSSERRKTTHIVKQHPIARFWIVPYRSGWHMAHHVDMGLPFRKLPALHNELIACGWITSELEYPSYRVLWRALRSK